MALSYALELDDALVVVLYGAQVAKGAQVTHYLLLGQAHVVHYHRLVLHEGSGQRHFVSDSLSDGLLGLVKHAILTDRGGDDLEIAVLPRVVVLESLEYGLLVGESEGEDVGVEALFDADGLGQQEGLGVHGLLDRLFLLEGLDGRDGLLGLLDTGGE